MLGLKIYFVLVICCISVQQLSALECYVCVDQDDNEGKCVSTVNTCDYKQDRCLSVIRWGSTPFWEIGVPMQYFISKECADKTRCEAVRNSTIGLCDRIEWKDWTCAECCQGDRCNYYVTLDGSLTSSSMLLTLMCGLFVVFST